MSLIKAPDQVYLYIHNIYDQNKSGTRYENHPESIYKLTDWLLTTNQVL